MKKLVVVGGGTGTFNVLSGLKGKGFDLTAVISTFDSGGSTGVLRDEFGALPGGDLRRALVALAPDDDQNFLRKLFQVRFNAPESSLHDHSLGNLIMLGAEEVAEDKLSGIKELSRLLSIEGRVLPVSLDDAHICAELTDGSIIKTEAAIDIPKHDGSIPIKKIWLTTQAETHPETQEALREADYIVIGPGDLYTSLLPNLLTKGFCEAVAQSSAQIIFITNIMTKWGETHGLTATDHVRILLEHLGRDAVDAAILNEGVISAEVEAWYAREGKAPVVFDEAEVSQYARRIIRADVMSTTDVVRHNPEKIAQAILEFCKM